MSGTQAIEVALQAWRAAERRLAAVADGADGGLIVEVAECRAEYQRKSHESMIRWMAELKEAEGRRSHATPSTPPFHQAARDSQKIAAKIWENARSSDEDTPRTEKNRRKTPRPAVPGLG
jgi:hypothetical protein